MTSIDQICGHEGYIGAMLRCELSHQVATAKTVRRRRLFAGVLCLTAAAGMVRAAEIFKSVDANGHVVYSDHLDPSMPGSAVQLEGPSSPPHELHFCWTNCFTLVLDNGAYRRTDGTDESWTVESFSANGIVLHRHDAPVEWNGFSKDVVYAGQVSNDRLIGVTVNGKPASGVDASWGSALNTLPGSNAERDAKQPADAGPANGTVSSAEPPPVLEEDQPPLSEDGFLWTPGYWYQRDQRYFWIPGAWMRPPQFGFLWTPAYWGRAGTVFVFHPGHWGSTVGFYGGINYGYGYSGNGYTGGHWIGNSFAYNSAVNHVNPVVAHRTYSEPIANQNTRGLVSYTAPERKSGAAVTASPHQPQPRANEARETVAIERTEKASTPAQITRPATVVKTPSTGAPVKVNRVTSARQVPSK